MKIPGKGKESREILNHLEGFRDRDARWRDGRTFSNAFLVDPEATELAERAYTMYLWENGLDPSLFPSLVRLENEIVAMAAAHLRGDPRVVGSFTSGGTESVLLAVKTARDRALARNPGLDRPEMVLPVTAHPCFFKAAEYFRVEPVVVPVDPRTFKAEVSAMRARITGRTVLLAASAPSYAHGVVDPIPAIGELALEHDLLLHVDGCIGAFLLPYYRRLGAPVTDFDFTVPGVTSISMDFHKYAFAPKGASVVLYRDEKIRRHQFFAWSGWPGYTLVNATMQSSRSGGPLAATWAMLHHFGETGYLEVARGLKEAADRIVSGVGEIEHLYVLGRPEMSLVAIGSDALSVFRLSDAMKERGWHMYPQTGVADLRESLHLTVLPGNVDRVDAWLEDLRSCAQALASRSGKAPPAPGLREMLATIDLASLDEDGIAELLRAAGLDAGDAPGATAEVNEILNELPPRTANRILKVYYGLLFRHRPEV